jgi:hypothetical protein
MYTSQQPWVELYESLRDHEGAGAAAAVLEPWPARHADEVAWLADFSRRTDHDWKAAAGEDLCRLYAVSRVTAILLLRLQGDEDGRDPGGPVVSVDAFRRFHEALGFNVVAAPGFHPFFHEIVAVEQAAHAETPVEVVRETWPALMLGRMMFCRAGCVVRGGRAHVVKEVAERSTRYWAFRRNDRPCADLSHGWGGRSQWRTAFRRDYRLPGAFHYNVDGEKSLDGARKTEDGIPVAAMIELVRNRCLVRAAIDDRDLYPYRYSCTETG